MKTKSDWGSFDDCTIVNVKNKHVIEWTTYGDNDEYFLSREYWFKGYDFLAYDGHKEVLINEKITEDNTLEELIERTKLMRF